MYHFQNPVNDWPRAVAILPAGYWIKAVDNVQLLNEAKGVNPGIKTVLRHHYDTGQIFGGSLEENKVRARQFFSTFIDGTFDQYAHSVDAIEGFNEYYANSQNAQEKTDRLNWIIAANEVWTNEYRNQAKYAHIRLCSCNTAIGNDIPIDAARVVFEHDGLLGYHPYVAVDSGTNNINPNDWTSYSGRWTQMDAQYKAAGIFVNWLFTEGGPIERRADGGLDPQNGWKHPNVYGGNVDLYVANVQYFLSKTSNWNKTNNNRASNVTLFTSGGWDTWQWFETKQPEMDAIANMAKNYVPEEPEPMPECNGLPREQYNREYWVVPAALSESDRIALYTEAAKANKTVGPSYDDAGLGDLNNKTAVLYGIPKNDQQIFIDWYDENYPGTKLEFREIPIQLEIIDIVDALPKHESKTYGTRGLSEITTLVIHHTVSPPDRAISSIAAYHVDSNDWPGIGYHYVIKDTGEIFQTNHLATRSYHAGGANNYTVGIALQGDFTINMPPAAQRQAAAMLVSYLKNQLDIDSVVPHKQLSQTACPGATWDQWLIE